MTFDLGKELLPRTVTIERVATSEAYRGGCSAPG
jgi:hypothetical protein